MSCKECVKECIGELPCESGKRCAKVKSGVEVELSMPTWLVFGLITLVFYFMWR